MTFTKRIASLMLLLSLSLPALAMNLNEAMSQLSAAKDSGVVGEMPNGYLGVVKSAGEADAITKLINEARANEYQKLATQNGIQKADVEAIAGKKAIEKTPAGQYIQLNGKWIKK